MIAGMLFVCKGNTSHLFIIRLINVSLLDGIETECEIEGRF